MQTQKDTLYPFSFNLYLMAKPIGSVCNLDCQYCYYLEKEKMYPGVKAPRMSDELLEKFTKEYIECQTSPYVMFSWHGGETLIAGMDFFKKALKYQKYYAKGRQIANNLQTNGTMLTDDWCKFFHDNGFLIGISLDGPEHCHDRYRFTKNGKGSFKEVMRGVELLQKHDVEYNILSVVNDYNVNYPVEIYEFFKSIGARFMQFTPIVERLAERKDGLKLLSVKDTETTLASWSVPSLAYGKFMTDIFDKWVLSDVGEYYVQMFDSTLATYVGEQPSTCVWARTCGHAGVIEFNGDVYTCDHFVFPEYKLGNVYNSSIFSMMMSSGQLRFGQDKWDKLPTQCKQCQYVKMCNGECPKNRILKTKDGEEGLNYLCTGFKHYFQHVTPYMEFMANELKNQRPPANVMEWARQRMKK